MSGRDFSADLFGPSPNASPAGKDFSANLFGSPSNASSTGKDFSADLFGAAPLVPPQEPNKEILGGIPRQFADVPLKVGSGVVTGVRMIADAFGADNETSKNLRGVEDWVADLYSAQSKKDSKEVARIMKDAEDKGVLENVVAGIKAFSVAPVDLIANALGTSAPAILASLGTLLTGGAPLVVGAAGVGTGAIMGAGVVKGSIYDATKQILGEKTEMTPAQIEKTAIKAQEYKGENLDQIMLGALITGVGSVTGAETALARQLAKGIATTVAQKEAVKLATREATERAAKLGVAKNAAYTAGKEFLGEGAEGGQEQLAQNIAQQRLGFDVPTMRGVIGQGTLEGLAGLGMGAASGGREAAGAKRELAVQNLADTGAGTDAYKELFTPPGRAKAAQQTMTDEELEKAFNAPPKPKSTPAAETAAALVAKYALGEEQNMTTPEARGLYFILKNLGIENPTVDKTVGEIYRVKAMAALRDHFDKQNAAPIEETTTNVDEAAETTTNVDEATETVETETKGQQTSITADEELEEKRNALRAEMNRLAEEHKRLGVNSSQSDQVFKEFESVAAQLQALYEPIETVVTPPTTDIAPPAPARPLIPMSSAVQDVYKEELAAFKTNPNDLETLKGINSLEKKHGMPLTTAPQGRVLSAKKADDAIVEPGQGGQKLLEISPGPYNQRQPLLVKQVEEEKPLYPVDTEFSAEKAAESNLQELKDIRPSETSAYEYDPDLSPELNQEIANNIAAAEEESYTANKAALTEMSDKAAPSKYEISDEDKTTYEKIRVEHNANAKEKNAQRAELLPALEKAYQITKNVLREASKRVDTAITALDAYKKTNKITEDVEATDYATTKRVNKTDSKLVELTDAVDKAIAEEDQAADTQEKASDDIYKLGPEIKYLPEWAKKFSAVDKDIYFGNIKDGSEEEHRQAAQALLDNYAQRDANVGDSEQRVVNAYEETRTRNGKEYKIRFPLWRFLSDHAKETFREGLTNLSGLQLDRSFGNLAKYLNDQNKAISEQEKIAAGKAIQERLDRVAEKTKKDTAEREDATKGWRSEIDAVTGEVIPVLYGGAQERANKTTFNDNEKLRSLIADGNLAAALDHISNMKSVSAFNKIIARAIGSMLKGMKSPPRLKLVEKLSNNDYGQYNPSFVSENREYIGEISIRTAHPEILLHEAVHAVTVRVLHTYFEGNRNSLTATQKAGVQQLLKIMVLSKKYLGNDPAFASAYEDIYEFVSYALTNSEFKNALADMNLPGASKINYLLEVTAQEAMPKSLVNMPGQEGLKARKKFISDYNKKKQEVTNVDNMSTKPESAWTKFKLAIADLITAGYKEAKLKFYKVEKTDEVSVEESVENEEMAQEIEEVPISLKSLLFQEGVYGKSENQNFLMEVAAAFEDIMAPQTEAIALEDLSAKQKAPLKAEPREGGFDDPKIRSAYELTERETGQSKDKGFFKQLFSTAGWRNTASLLTDKTYEARSHWARQDLGENIIRDETKAFNHFTELMDTSTSIIQNYVTHNLSQHLEELKKSMQDYAALVRNGDMDAAYIDIHMLGEMFGEPERREAFFVTTVPLSKENTGPKAVTFLGKQMGAANVRTEILGDPSTGAEGLIHKYVLTDTQKQNFWNILKGLANTHADYSGYSPRNLTFSAANKKAGIGLKKDDPTYNVLGISTDEVNLRKEQYKDYSETRKDAIQRIFTSFKALTDATKELNQIGNFWSAPVTNLTDMYNYQYYMPFKGLSKFNETKDPDIMVRYVDPNRITEGKSKVLLDQEYATGGRFSVSDNPILQVMFDSFRAAHRAGIVKATEALKNSAKYDKVKNPNGTGIINAEIVENIPLARREISDIEKYKGSPNVVFHYKEDGSIDVIKIYEPKLAAAIRYTYKKNNVTLDAANTITSWFGSMHTRYNWNFAPKNFVVDMLTNAWNIGGGKFGPANALVYIGDVGASVMRNGLGKAMQVAYLHDKGDPASRKQLLDMADKDPFVRDMVEMLRFGGKSVYIDSMALRANYEKLSKVGRNKILANLDQFNAIVDTWNNMFEFTSRTAAYTLFKEKMYAANIAAGMSDVKGPNNRMSPAKLAAAEQAAAETKNLANFEKVGEIGRELGAAFMFFRPSAMGAARAIETVAPAFMFTDNMIKNNMPGNIQDDPVASALYMENYKKLRTNAQVMTSALIGMGYVMYLMSMMMAPDDEWKRNSVRSDDMQQWTKFARFHLPDEVSKQIFGKDSKNIVLQMPWGFGLGAFAAIGAQIGGMAHGQASWQKGFGNIGMSILSDSFLPIPISRIPPTESPGKWALDSVTPSVLRPMFEYFMNTNGIGQAINSANTRKYGEAFTGGDKIPDLYKDTARDIYSATQGAWDFSPNTMYFFANSYLDGISRVGETAYSWTNLIKGEKIFNPKTDLALIGSFFGSKSNVDSREFTSVETKLKDLSQRIKTLYDKDPVAYVRFTANNPMADAAVGLYNSELVNINRIRAEANEIRTGPYSPKLKEQLLRINILQQNMAKHELILTLKAYGVEP